MRFSHAVAGQALQHGDGILDELRLVRTGAGALHAHEREPGLTEVAGRRLPIPVGRLRRIGGNAESVFMQDAEVELRIDVACLGKRHPRIPRRLVIAPQIGLVAGKEIA